MAPAALNISFNIRNYLIMKKIRATFLTTRYDLMKKHWEKHATLNKQGVPGTNVPIGRDINLGGVMIDVDWQTKDIRKTLLSCPSGVAVRGSLLAVASMRQNEIYFIDDKGDIVKTISHPYLSDIHSIAFTDAHTLLVTNTGLDAIIELDMDGVLVWSWFAMDHGYEKDSYGNIRSLQREGVDHRRMDYPALFQTTHINSVIPHPDKHGVVLATLFYQGEVIEIDKSTGLASVVFSGLSNPHSIKKIGEGYIVSNTKKGEVIFLDNKYRETRRIATGSAWLQDADISPWGTLFAARGDIGDIAEISLENGSIIDRYVYDPTWRIYQITFPLGVSHGLN